MALTKEDIVYEDEHILAIHKRAGLATQTAKIGEADLISEAKNYIALKKGKTGDIYIGLINRLDQPVEGIVLLGLDKKTTAGLSEQLQSGGLDKHYYARVYGSVKPTEALVSDFLIKDSATNKTIIVDDGTAGAQRALLEYKVCEDKSDDKSSLVDIHLITGRHHQIRVQMSGMGHPILGDKKYGTVDSEGESVARRIRTVALCAYRLSFEHPVTDKRIELSVSPKGEWMSN